MTKSCFVLGLSMTAASLGPASAFTAPLSVRSSHRQYCGRKQSLLMTAPESTPADARAEVRACQFMWCWCYCCRVHGGESASGSGVGGGRAVVMPVTGDR